MLVDSAVHFIWNIQSLSEYSDDSSFSADADIFISQS